MIHASLSTAGLLQEGLRAAFLAMGSFDAVLLQDHETTIMQWIEEEKSLNVRKAAAALLAKIGWEEADMEGKG